MVIFHSPTVRPLASALTQAALNESSQRNIYGVPDGASQVATHGLDKMDAADAAGGLDSSLI